MIQSCPHLHKTIDEKPCCIDCGLVFDIENPPYVRCLKHYKFFVDNNIQIPIKDLPNEKLKIQVLNFLERHDKFSLPTFNHTILYQNYINFLETYKTETLPQKIRKRPITKICGIHKKMFLDFLLNFDVSLFSIEED